MVTRVRIEAEGRSTQEVEETLQTAFEVLGSGSKAELARMYGPNHEALVEARAGEFVIERFVRESGAIFYRGRQVAHYRESEGVKLKGRTENPTHAYMHGSLLDEAHAGVAEATAEMAREAERRTDLSKRQLDVLGGDCTCGPTETCSNCPQ